jgi:indole-3-glycerol phosphate synthase
LQQILRDKRRELEAVRLDDPLEQVQARIATMPPPRDFIKALQGPNLRVIAEVKKASPSKGLLAPNFNPVELARAYCQAGAAAISVLTDKPYFQGHIFYLARIRESLGEQCPPLLRKDFIIDPYQLYEARAYGADAVLLIVAALEERQLMSLLQEARHLGMEALVEVHTQQEVQVALRCGAKVIGINNRDLHTFKTTLETTRTLRRLIPDGCVVVSESGIEGPKDIETLRKLGVHAVLIGEALVTAPDPARKLRELLEVP